MVAVVVTWNRRELLEEALAALRAQSHQLAEIVVVDNASTDGTDELLTGQTDLDVVRLAQNTGGAGGFAVGIERALTHRPDLVWLLDDDTIPTPDAARELARTWREYDDGSGRPPAVLASKVVWTDGRDHPMNTPRRKPGAKRTEVAAADKVGAMPVRSASFVSIMCDADVVRERGLPIADYFLWNDDFEYSTRLIRDRVGLYCPASVVLHKTKVFGSTDADPGERFFYEVRNKVWLFTRSRGPDAGGEGGLRRLDPAPLGAHLRRLQRPAHAAAGGRARGSRPAWPAARGPTRRCSRARAPRPDRTLPPGQPFALLISTYAGDRPDYLREAFVSTVHEQTRRPAQVVLVQDGPVGGCPRRRDRRAGRESPVPVTHVELPENQGLGPALDAGLKASEHEIVARMDADDVSLPDRFEKQLPLIEAGADIVGSGLWEFGISIEDVVGRRTPPTDPDEIRRVVRFRDPFNHPTVVYRRSAVLAAGGYADMALMEDYLLFTRMVAGGAVPANLAEPLVHYRVGDGAYARRGGRQLLRSELALQRRFRELGLTTRGQYLRNVAVRGGYRLVPEGVRKVAYRRLLANRSGEPRG